MAETIIKTIDVSKSFKGEQVFQALDKVSIEVDRGEFVAITGSSGSGKSTLLYLLSTLDTDYTGEIWLAGRNLHQLSKNQLSELRNKEIGFVFQFHYLLPEFTVLENVSLPAFKLGKYSHEEIRERALEKLDLLGLKSQADKTAAKLSGGQQQRVAIARALINDPSILFGDEPTGNLDSINGKLVFDIFRQLSKEFNQTIVMVTHDNEIAENTDRRIVLKDGKVLSLGYKD